jgi:hypothetical protein
MPAQDCSILSIARALRKRARYRLSFRLPLHLTVALLVLASVFVEHWLEWVLALSAFALQALALWLKDQSIDDHLLSREAQRMFLLDDAFGRASAPADCSDLLVRAGLPESAAKPAGDEHLFFATRQPPGVNRLVMNVAESCFYTHSILSEHRRRALITVVVVAVCLIGGVAVVLTEGPAGSREQFLAAAGAFALVLVDDIDVLANLHRSVEAVHQVETRIEKACAGGVGSATAHALFIEYSVATAMGVPLANRIYESQRERLAALWKMREDRFEEELASRAAADS